MTRKEKIKNGRILVDNGYGTTYDFEIVEKMPQNFEVWNIPEIGNGEYIPICESSKDYSVDTKTLKAIKLSKEEVLILHKAASEGDKTVKKIKSTLKRVAKTAAMRRRQEKARKALPILERITA